VRRPRDLAERRGGSRSFSRPRWREALLPSPVGVGRFLTMTVLLAVCAFVLSFDALRTLPLTGGVSALGRQYGEHEPYMSTELFHEVTEKPRGALVQHLAVFGEDIRLILDVGLGGVHLW